MPRSITARNGRLYLDGQPITWDEPIVQHGALSFIEKTCLTCEHWDRGFTWSFQKEPNTWGSCKLFEQYAKDYETHRTDIPCPSDEYVPISVPKDFGCKHYQSIKIGE